MINNYRKFFQLIILVILSLAYSCSKSEPDKDVAPPKPHIKTDVFCVAGLNKKDASVGFDVKVENSQSYKLYIVGLTSSDVSATGSVYVNGVINSQIKFDVSPQWTKILLNVTLNAGLNSIVIKRDLKDNGLFFLDYIEIK